MKRLEFAPGGRAFWVVDCDAHDCDVFHELPTPEPWVSVVQALDVGILRQVNDFCSTGCMLVTFQQMVAAQLRRHRQEVAQ